MTHVEGGAGDGVPAVLLYPLFVAVDHMSLWDIQGDRLRLRTVWSIGTHVHTLIDSQT